VFTLLKGMWRALTLALLLALAAAAPAAAAVRVVAPPGNSEADQYFETLPASSGPHAPDSSKEEADAVRDGNLSPATAQALGHHGAAGRAVATTVAKTAPARAPRPGGVSPASAVRIPGGAGLGPAFPLVLAVAAAAAVGFAVARRRRAPVR
jgi:hypothetical protein